MQPKDSHSSESALRLKYSPLAGQVQDVSAWVSKHNPVPDLNSLG